MSKTQQRESNTATNNPKNICFGTPFGTSLASEVCVDPSAPV